MRGRTNLSPAAAVAAMLLTCGCAGGDPAAGDWVLASIAGEPAPDSSPVRMEIEAGEVRGTDGCNDFRARLVPDGPAGAVTGFQSTLRACEDRADQGRAERVAAILGASPRYERRGDILTIRSAAGELSLRRGADRATPDPRASAPDG